MNSNAESEAAFDPDADRLREECGVFGIFGHADAAALTALGLHALQHRGQEAAGIVSYDGSRFHSERRLGLVGDAFSEAAVMDRLKGTQAIGHVRYSTTGEAIREIAAAGHPQLDAAYGLRKAHPGDAPAAVVLPRDRLAARQGGNGRGEDRRRLLHAQGPAARLRGRGIPGIAPAAPRPALVGPRIVADHGDLRRGLRSRGVRIRRADVGVRCSDGVQPLVRRWLTLAHLRLSDYGRIAILDDS